MIGFGTCPLSCGYVYTHMGTYTCTVCIVCMYIIDSQTCMDTGTYACTHTMYTRACIHVHIHMYTHMDCA